MKRVVSAALSGLALCLTACGGGGGGSATAPTAAAPASNASTSVFSSGTITGFGSVFVNGVRFDTSAATFTINGVPGTQSDLRVGQVISVRGHRNSDGSSHADRIAFDDLVKGPMSSVDVAAGRLVVLGQTVVVDGDTSFDDSITGASLAGLVAGDIVEVSGMRQADGLIHATRVEKKPAGTMFEVTGRASAIDTTLRKLTVHGLVVNYSGATLLNFASGQPQNGDLVEAKGAAVNASNELVATSLERKGVDDPSDRGLETEIEGLVTRFVSAADFDVAGKRVTTTSSTRFENGTPADLLLNTKVEVEGQLDSAGVLVASKVQFKRQSSARLEARVDAVDATTGKLTVLGVEITTSGTTRFEDKGDVRVASFKLSDIAVGDYVEVRGVELPVDSNKVAASSIERRRAESEVRLRGIVDTIARPSLTILGVTVQTSASTQFENEADAVIAADAFFAAAQGRVVAAKGTVSGGVFTAREVELEHD